jgi:hypothetical protein
MSTPAALLKFVAKAALNAVGGGVAGDFAVEVVPELARDVWKRWSGGRRAEELRADVQAVAQLSNAEARQQAEHLAAVEAAGQAEQVRNNLAAYLAQVPASIRQSQRRASDSTGRSLSLALSLQGPQDLLLRPASEAAGSGN